MALKDRLKKTFGKKSGSSPGPASRTPSTAEYSYTGRKDIEYYKPHEVPKSKYKGKVDPEHKEHLESFCFTDAFASPIRRKPSQALSGIMSPGGTKSQSRRASYVSQACEEDSESDLALDIQTSTRTSTSEGSDSLDTALSRAETLRPERTPPLSTPKLPLDILEEAAVSSTEAVAIVNDQLFTTNELEKALTEVTLRAGHEGVNRNSSVVAAH